jgi:hypothetical protein
VLDLRLEFKLVLKKEMEFVELEYRMELVFILE